MQLRNKRIVVTGGAGFIGSHVVDLLLKKMNQVIIIDNFSTGKWENIDRHRASGQLHIVEADVRDLEKMILVTKGVDVIFHMAVACLRRSINDPISVHETNTTGTLNMCHAAEKNKIERFIYISSSETYGSALYVPMDEGHPLNPSTLYGASKAAGELYTLAYWRTYGLPSIIVRPFNTYGPREPSEGFRAEVIPKFVMRTLAGIPPVIFGTGQQTRDFTFVEDTARGIVMAAECDELVGDRINIASGEEVSIERICQLVLEKIDSNHLTPQYLEDERPGDLDRHNADISKAQSFINYSPAVKIDQGIEKYIKWVQSQSLDLDSWVFQERIRNW